MTLKMVFSVYYLYLIHEERLMVWMRVAAVSNFRKLWGRIEQDVEAGEYLLTISNSNIIFVIFIGQLYRLRCFKIPREKIYHSK